MEPGTVVAGEGERLWSTCKRRLELHDVDAKEQRKNGAYFFLFSGVGGGVRFAEPRPQDQPV